MRGNINQSLNLLKELEVRLKTQHTEKLQHKRTKTQSNQTVTKNAKPWGQRCIEAYEQNQQELKQQNRQLKRYVNRLIKMNDYLKNQLVQGQHFAKKESIKNADEEKDIKMLRVQVQYLKELNRQKQLQIQILKQNQKNRTKKKSIFTQLTQQSCSSNKKINTTTRHKRQSSSKSSVMRKSDLSGCFMKHSSSKVNSKCGLCYN